MILLNDVAYDYCPGMSLKELVDEHNKTARIKAGFDDYVIVVNGVAIAPALARERVLCDGDKIIIVTALDAG